MTGCATTDPNLRCSKGRRCLRCMERDALARTAFGQLNAVREQALGLTDSLLQIARLRKR